MNNTQQETSNPVDELSDKARDLEWVRRIQGGDLRAFEELVRAYQDRVYRLAYSLMRNRDDAQDVAQEAFLRVHGSIKRFEGKSAFSTWIYRIVVNLCHDSRRRKNRRQGEFSIDQVSAEREESGEAPMELADEAGIDPGRQATEAELEHLVMAAIEELSDPHRTTILLREVENLSYEEIAEATEVSIGTVMSRLHYARKKLQETLAPYLLE